MSKLPEDSFPKILTDGHFLGEMTGTLVSAERPLLLSCAEDPETSPTDSLGLKSDGFSPRILHGGRFSKESRASAATSLGSI